MNDTVYLTGKDLSIEEIIKIAENAYKVDFPERLKTKIAEFRKGLDKQLKEHPEIKMYGVNVGCGDLKDKEISPQVFVDYQRKYVKAHNCGSGKELPVEVVRAMMVIRLNSFARGFSAVRLETCQLMIDMLNKNVTPLVLEEGSVGASGDLIPLAMIAGTLIGLDESKAYYNGVLHSSKDALAKANLKPTQLQAKEAMALTNGTSFMAALAVFAYKDLNILLKNVSISAALSLEAIRGEKNAFSKFLNENKPHEGQLYIAQEIRNLIKNSKRMTCKAQNLRFKWQLQETVKERIQDRYSFRAIPQVHGTLVESLKKLKDVIYIEINSATDNPLIFINENGMYTAQSGANFHGQALSSVIDYVKITLTSVGLISDKRIFSLLNRYLSYGLPSNLAYDIASGDTGLMLTQYASAARAAESRILSGPASITSITTSANQEDFVSMGSIGVLHLHKIIYNVQLIIAIELLCALRAIQITYDLDCLKNEKDKILQNLYYLQGLGKETKKVYKYLNTKLPPVKGDKFLQNDMDAMLKIVKSGVLIKQTFKKS